MPEVIEDVQPVLDVARTDPARTAPPGSTTRDLAPVHLELGAMTHFSAIESRADITGRYALPLEILTVRRLARGGRARGAERSRTMRRRSSFMPGMLMPGTDSVGPLCAPSAHR